MDTDVSEGRVEMESGTWRWHVTEGVSGSSSYEAGNRPAGEADPDPRPEAGPVLVLEDPSDPDHWMTKEIDRATRAEGVSAESVASLARNPDRRQITDPEGRTWTVDRIDEPTGSREGADADHPPTTLRVTRDGGPHRTVTMPEGRFLGQMTRSELVRLVGDDDATS